MSKSQLLISSIFKTFFLSLCMISIATFAHAQTASILPNAKTTFLDNNGNPLTSGQVFFYIPGTTTPKTTWQDAAETIPNTNPVILDGYGRALILGSGSYRQRVTDKNHNLIWDQVTSSAAGGGGGGPKVGDGNAVGTILPWSGFVPPPNYLFSYGQELSRTTYSVLLAAITQVQNITCQSGSPTLTSVADTSQLPIGARVESACVSASSSVISKTVNTVTLNTNAIVSVTATATFFPWGEGNGLTTFNTPDLRGAYLPGRCNMGGASCSLLSNPNYNDPNAINGVGGSQTAILAAVNLPPHTHSPSTVNDPGHTHAGGQATNKSGFAGGSASTLWFGAAIATATAVTGITLSDTGTNASGTSTAFGIVPPSKTINYIIKVLPDTNIGTSSISQLAPGVPNQLAGTDNNGIWGNVTVPTGLSVASSALNFNIPALTAQVSPNANNDYLILYNAASGTTQKVTVGLVASAATAGVSSFNGLTGAVTGISSIDGATGAVIGVDINSGRRVTTTPTVTNSDCNRPLYLGGNTKYTVTINSSDTYSAGCRFILINSDTYTGVGTGRGKLMAINGITNHFLYPGQELTIRQCLTAVCGSNIWIADQTLSGVDGQVWFAPTNNVIFFMDTGGSDTANDGLASGASGAFQSPPGCVGAAYARVYMRVLESTIICSGTAGQTFSPGTLTTAFFQLPNSSLTINSTTPGTQWNWSCFTNLPCLQFGDNFLGGVTDVNFVGSSTSPSLITGHQFSIIDLINVTLTGASNATNALTCDSDTHYNISGGFRFTGTMQLIINACQGSSWQITNGFSATGTASITRPFNFFSGSKGTFGGNVTYTNTGATYAGEALISGNSVVNNFGTGTFPGLTGTPTVSTGGQFCNIGTGPC